MTQTGTGVAAKTGRMSDEWFSILDAADAECAAEMKSYWGVEIDKLKGMLEVK